MLSFLPTPLFVIFTPPVQARARSQTEMLPWCDLGTLQFHPLVECNEFEAKWRRSGGEVEAVFDIPDRGQIFLGPE